MKISFSTLGCPGWSWEDMVSTAKDLGFDGIEIRGIENEIYVPKAKPFIESNIRATVERLGRLGLEIPCITSSCYLFDKDRKAEFLKEGMDYINLAVKLGAPYVRVLGDTNPEPGKGIDIRVVAENLSELCSYAEGKNVKLLVETNGCFADSSKMLELMGIVNSPNAGVLWDVHHPFRFFGEEIEHTYSMLKKYVEFVHIKDSAVVDGKIKYRMMGYGSVPVREAVQLLKHSGYAGYISLEWVKRWCIDLEEPGVVFSHYANFIRSML